MRLLHLECPVGLGGDMLLAALAGLGSELQRSEAESTSLDALARALGSRVLSALALKPESRGGIAGVRLAAQLAQSSFRNLEDILALLDAADFSETVRSRTANAMARLAEVEAQVHGLPLDRVHFHEIGAADTILDVAGAFWFLEQLAVERVTCSPLPWFQGRVRCEHGELPLPAPATVVLLKGKPVHPSEYQCELITPTGALLLDQCVDAFLPGPQGQLLASSLAYGAMDFGAGAGLRVHLLEAGEDMPGPPLPEGAALETVWVLESNLDHLSGEDLGHCFEALLAAGALDVAHLPAVMKKNRPGGVLQAICADKDLESVQDSFFRNTLTLGLRRRRMERVALPRMPAALRSSWGELEAKSGRYKDDFWTSPEYEALRQLSQRTGKSPALLRRLLQQGDDEGLDEK